MTVFPIVALVMLSTLIVVVNFISYMFKGKAIVGDMLWKIVQIWTVVVLPTIFLLSMDLPNGNDCCADSAVFSPEHRIGIYVLIILAIIALIVTIARTRLLPPVAELCLNVLLILGLGLNLLFCIHFTTVEEGYLWWLFGNIPIILVLLMAMSENQKLLTNYMKENEHGPNSIVGKLCGNILTLHPILKYPILSVLIVPFILLVSSLLILFGQKPDSLIQAFTQTYKHGFSQLDHLCANAECGGHFLCSVGANGHEKIVKPIRYGERNGKRIICNRQLLISNAFEELLEEKLPKAHATLRRSYNKIGNQIHRHYHFFNNPFVSDMVYVLMKPAEVFFLVALYTFDKRPENRIAMQYLKSKDRKNIKRLMAKY